MCVIHVLRLWLILTVQRRKKADDSRREPKAMRMAMGVASRTSLGTAQKPTGCRHHGALNVQRTRHENCARMIIHSSAHLAKKMRWRCSYVAFLGSFFSTSGSFFCRSACLRLNQRAVQHKVCTYPRRGYGRASTGFGASTYMIAAWFAGKIQ